MGGMPGVWARAPRDSPGSASQRADPADTAGAGSGRGKPDCDATASHER